jgi:D-alanyl-D-alanine carboxypeptidase (penicillin-binding protein 5/6)
MLRCVLLALFSCSIGVAADLAEPPVYLVMNATNGHIIVQKGAHKKCYPASLTKIATVAYITCTQPVDLNKRIVVPSEAVRAVSCAQRKQDNYTKYPTYILEIGGSSAGLKTGEEISMKDALWGTMLPSGNDAANTLAYYWGDGSIPTFCEKLNRWVESIGCHNTHFVNPHGLHHPEHVTTAYDIALISRVAMQSPLFRSIVRSPSYTKEQTNKQPEVVFQQINRLLVHGPYFLEQATGIKTGHHSLARQCISASAESSDRALIVVLLQCQERKPMFLLAKKILHHFLSEEKTNQTIVEQGVVSLQRDIEGHNTPLTVRAAKKSVVSFYPSEKPEIQAVAEWKPLHFPIEEGQEIGQLKIFTDKTQVDIVPLLSNERREATWNQRLIHIQRMLKRHYFLAIILAVAAATTVVFLLRKNRRTFH